MIKSLYESILDTSSLEGAIPKNAEDIVRLRKDVVKWLKDKFDIDYLVHDAISSLGNAKAIDTTIKDDPNHLYISKSTSIKKNVIDTTDAVMFDLMKKWKYRRIDASKVGHVIIVRYYSDVITDAYITIEAYVDTELDAVVRYTIMFGGRFSNMLPVRELK